MKHRAASRAVSRIATPKNCAASPRFVIAQVPGYNGNLCTPAGQAAGYSSSRESGIKRVLTENNRAVGLQWEDGTKVEADIVISAADGYGTVLKMLDGRFVDDRIRNIYKNRRVVPSYVHVHLGVNMDLAGGAGLDNAVYYLLELDAPITVAGKEFKYLPVKNYSFDPAISPVGKSTLAVGFNSEAAYWERIYPHKAEYVREKKKLETAVVSALERIFPAIVQKIEAVDISTPMTIVRYTGNWQGSIMGFMRDFSRAIPRTLPKLDGFYMAGHWVGDTGVIGAACSGREIVEWICHKDKKRFVTTVP
jgi:phytoene dehydrogenase-like protein